MPNIALNSSMSPMPKGSQFVFGAFFVATLTIIVVFASVGIWVHPMADDFSFASKTFGFKPIWVSVKGFYLSYSGLYTAILCRHLHATLTHMEHYWLIAWVILLTHGAAFFFLMRVFVMRKEALILTLGCLAVFLVNMPHVGDFLYWATGAVVYAPGTLLFLLLLLSSAHWLMGGEGLRYRRTLEGIMIVIMIFLCGTHYQFAVWAFVWAVALAITTYRQRIEGRTFWLVLSVISLVCVVLVFAAPGNMKRAGRAVDALTTAPDLARSIYSYSQTAWSFLFNIPMLALSGFAVTTLLARKNQIKPVAWGALGWMTMVIWLVVSVVTFVLAAIGGLSPPAGRTLDALLLMFIASWFVFLLVYLTRVTEVWRTEIWVSSAYLNKASLLFMLVFSASIFLDGNFRPTFADLVKHGPAYSKEMQLRDETLRSAAAAGMRCATVSRIKVKPNTFSNYDLNGDLTQGRMLRMAKYYGLDAIALSDGTPCP